MGAIYKSQISWNGVEAPRRSEARVKDYVSQGLNDLAGAAMKVADEIATQQNKEDAALMQAKAAEAQAFIDNFEDFSGDDYMGKMVDGALQIWQDGFKSMTPARARRFAYNNPQSTEVFLAKAREAAVEKSYSHAKTENMRRIADRASAIVSLGNKDDIKSAMIEEVWNASNNYGLRQADLNEYVDSLQYEVAQGAIASAIGEGRTQDAADLNNDLEFTNRLTPSQRAANNKTIKTLAEAQAKSRAEGKTKESEVLQNGLIAAADAIFATAGTDEMAREQAVRTINKMFNDVHSGKLSTMYGGVPTDALIPGFSEAFGKVPYSARQKAVREAYDAVLKNSPEDRRVKAVVGYKIMDFAASLDTDKDGHVILGKDGDNIKPEDIADLRDILKTADEFYAFDKGVDDKLQELRQIYYQYETKFMSSIAPTFYSSGSDVISNAGRTSEHYAYSGNVSTERMQELREGKTDPHGVNYEKRMDEAYEFIRERVAEQLPGWDEVEPGSYREMLLRQVADFRYMSAEDLDKLGLAGLTDRQIMDNFFTQVHEHHANGTLDSQVDRTMGLQRPASTETDFYKLPKAERKKLAEQVGLSAGKRGKVSDTVRSLWGGDLSKDGKAMNIKEGSFAKLPSDTVEALLDNGRFPTNKVFYGADGKPLTNVDKIRLEELWNQTVVEPLGYALKSPRGMLGSEEVMSAPIEDTSFYSSLKASVMRMNRGANPDETTLKKVAAALRRSTTQGEDKFRTGPVTLARPGAYTVAVN